MKFLVTFVPISRTTRKRTGKAKTKIVEGASPQQVERLFEKYSDVKVVDVREVGKS